MFTDPGGVADQIRGDVNFLRDNGADLNAPDRRQTRWYAASVAALLYFSEGLPFGIVSDLMPVYLRVHGVDLTTIGFLSTVASAWTLKVFWSPMIDAFGTYRRWIATAVLAMAICMGVLVAMPVNFGTTFWT